MDDELRELEQAGQKAVSAVSKVTNYTEQMLQTLLNASGKTLGFAGKQVKKANDIERERHRAKKAEKGSEVKVSDKISGSNSHLESFNFTGKRTDLCYFANTDRMPLSAIANIPDRELKDKVVETFNALCSKKYGCIKVEGDEIVITDKGKKMLQDGAFKKQAMNDQLEAYGKQFEKMFGQAPEGQQMLGVALNSDGVHDFAFFNHSENLDLKQILANPNGKLRDQIVENIKHWQQNGLVNIKDGMAIITEKGKDVLDKVKEAVNSMSEMSIDSIKHTSDSIIVTTRAIKKTAEKSAEKAVKKAEKTASKIIKKAAQIK